MYNKSPNNESMSAALVGYHVPENGLEMVVGSAFIEYIKLPLLGKVDGPLILIAVIAALGVV
jgi:hypothetical protein